MYIYIYIYIYYIYTSNVFNLVRKNVVIIFFKPFFPPINFPVKWHQDNLYYKRKTAKPHATEQAKFFQHNNSPK